MEKKNAEEDNENIWGWTLRKMRSKWFFLIFINIQQNFKNYPGCNKIVFKTHKVPPLAIKIPTECTKVNFSKLLDISDYFYLLVLTANPP
jgi:hypothetical protein